MSLFKSNKRSKKVIVATAVGGAVAAGAAALYSTKKGKAMLKDASDGISSLLGSAEKLHKTIRKEAKRPARKASIAKRARKAVSKAKRG